MSRQRKSFGTLPEAVEIDLESEGVRRRILEAALTMKSSAPKPRKDHSPWSYVANCEMSGLPSGCVLYDCREQKLADTLAFSTLYADQVVLFNPLSQLLIEDFPVDEVDVQEISPQFFHDLLFAMHAFQSAKPLMDAGIATFIDFDPKAICVDCIDKLLLSAAQETDNKFEFFEAYNQLLSTSQVNLAEIDDEKVVLEVKSPMFSQEHDEMYFYMQDIEFAALLSNFELGEALPKDIIHQFQIFHEMAMFGSADLISRNVSVQTYGIGTIFSNSLETKVMKRVFGHSFIENKFSLDLPFVNTMAYESVLEMREKYWYEFENFRKLFSDLAFSPDAPDEEVLRTIDKDVVPELAKLESVVRKHRETSRNDVLQNCAISSVAIGSALLTSGMSGLVAAAAGVLGGGHIAKETIPSLRRLATEPEAASESQMYFAWKVKKQLA